MADVAMAVNAMRLGAYDFCGKALPGPNRLVENGEGGRPKNRRLILQGQSATGSAR